MNSPRLGHHPQHPSAENREGSQGSLCSHTGGPPNVVKDATLRTNCRFCLGAPRALSGGFPASQAYPVQSPARHRLGGGISVQSCRHVPGSHRCRGQCPPLSSPGVRGHMRRAAAEEIVTAGSFCFSLTELIRSHHQVFRNNAENFDRKSRPGHFRVKRVSAPVLASSRVTVPAVLPGEVWACVGITLSSCRRPEGSALSHSPPARRRSVLQEPLSPDVVGSVRD